MYKGTPSLCAFALAKASHTGDHSEPGEAKIRSTPICESTRNNVSAPVRPSVSIMAISLFLSVSIVSVVPIVPDVSIISRRSRTLYQISARCCNSWKSIKPPLHTKPTQDLTLTLSPELVEKAALFHFIQETPIDELLNFDLFCLRIDSGKLVNTANQRKMAPVDAIA